MTTKNETIKTLLARFNEMRVANNENAIAKWSKSKNDLIDAIAAYVVDVDDDNTMSVADLARELNINPKIARAKLRRRGIYATHGSHVRFTRDDATFNEYVAILTSARVAKTQ